MKMQDEQLKVTLCVRTLLICCLSAQLLSTDNKLWLKFLYLIFDKQPKEIQNFLQNHADALIQACMSNQRLQKVKHYRLLFI